MRRTHGGKHPRPRDSSRSGLQRFSATSAPSTSVRSRPSATSVLRKVEPRARSTTSSAARVEAKSTSCRPRPSQSGRPTPRARCSTSGSRSSIQAAAIAPTSCSSDARCGAVRSTSAKIASESTVISRLRRSMPCRAKSSSSLTMIPLWIPSTAPWRTGGCSRRSSGGPSCSRARGRAPEPRRPGRRPRRAARSRRSAACGPRVGPRRAIRVADGVGAALGDPGQQRLRGQRPARRSTGLRSCIPLCRTCCRSTLNVPRTLRQP